MNKSSILLFLTLVLTSCGTDSNHFKIAGRFLNLNQGEFYIYSADGGNASFDTIKVEGGRFSREIECKSPQTFMLVFPNFSEQPLFGTPGKTVDVKADASHLKEMEVTGTKENEQMTAFRKRIANVSPPEAKSLAAQFIKDNPESRVSNYLLRRFFLLAQQPDFVQAEKLADLLADAQKENVQLANLKRMVKDLNNAAANTSLPAFAATDSKGRVVSSSEFAGKVGLIYTWASWNYESLGSQRKLKNLKRKYPADLYIVGISLDPSKRDCNNNANRDSISWSNVCDELMFEGPLIGKLGLRGINDNIIVSKSGRIVAHGLSNTQMFEELEKQLKK